MADTAQNAQHSPTPRVFQVPEWEHEAAANRNEKTTSQSRRSPLAALGSKFNSIMPPHRRYLRMSRTVFLCVLCVVVLALLALIIGLAVGLTRRSGSAQNLPLPSNTQTFTGDLTYYGTGLGACGETSGDDDLIVSISHIVFDAAGSTSSNGGNSNENPLCNLMVRASRFDEQAGGRRSVDLKVVDRCTGCQPSDLDTSLGAFEKLAAEEKGRVDVTWAWLQPTPTG